MSTRCKARVSRQCQAEIKWESSCSHNTTQPTPCAINNIFETSGRCQLNDERALIQREFTKNMEPTATFWEKKTSIWALREVGISPKPRDWSQWCQVLGNGGPFEVVNFQLKALVVALLGLEVRSCSYSWFTWEVLGRQLREVCCLNRLCKHVPQPCYLWLKGKLTQLFTWVAGFGCQVTLIISAIQFCVVDEPASTCNL